MASEIREEIRTMIRQEIARALRILDYTSEDYDRYDTGELESGTRRVISKVADKAADAILTAYHSPHCGAGWGGEHEVNCETGEDN